MQLVRYLLVQVVAYFIDMGGFILLFAYFDIEPLLANVVSKVLAGVFAFGAHRRFTFEVAETNTKVKQGVRYFALLALNIPISALTLGATSWLVPMAVVAKSIADMICVALTYLLSKRLVFTDGDQVKSNFDSGRGEQ